VAPGFEPRRNNPTHRLQIRRGGAKPTPTVTTRERDALRELDPDGAFETEAAIKPDPS